MNVPKTIKFKTFVLSIVAILIVLFAGLSYVLSQSSGTFTISQGVYPGATSFTLWREDSNYYAKNAYGVIEYSGTNATQVIQNALNSANKGIVFLTDATYVIDKLSPPSNSWLCGEGWRTILFLRNSANVTMIELPNAAKNVTIENLALNGNKANQNPGYPVFLINTSNVMYCNFLHLDAYGCYGGGIKIFGYSYQNLISECWIHDNGETGTGYSNGIILDDHCGRNIVSNNRIYNNFKDGIMCDSLASDNVISGNLIWGNQATGIGIFSASSGWESIGLTITGNVITDNSWHGIDVNGWQKGITITGNTITYNRRMGIDVLNSNYTLISGNTIAYNSVDNNGTYNGITIDSSFHTTITGNQIFDDRNTPSQKWGIEEMYDSPQADYNTIIANDCHGNSVGGIRVYGGNTQVNLCWNGSTWIS